MKKPLEPWQRERIRALCGATQCGLLDAKEALLATGWDVEKAISWVRNKGNC